MEDVDENLLRAHILKNLSMQIDDLFDRFACLDKRILDESLTEADALVASLSNASDSTEATEIVKEHFSKATKSSKASLFELKGNVMMDERIRIALGTALVTTLALAAIKDDRTHFLRPSGYWRQWSPHLFSKSDYWFSAIYFGMAAFFDPEMSEKKGKNDRTCQRRGNCPS